MSLLILMAVILGMVVPAILYKFTEGINAVWVRFAICVIFGVSLSYAIVYSFYIQFLC